MASVRKRIWKSGGAEKTSWIVDYTIAAKQHIKTFRTKRDADAWRTEVEREIRLGMHTPASQSPTVYEAAKAWIRQAQIDGLERSTIAQYRQHADLHITHLIGDRRISDLTPAGVQAFRNALLEERSPAMAKRVLTSLGAILEHARDNGQIARNVVRERRGKRQQRVESRHKEPLQIGIDIPSLDEVRAMLNAVPARWRTFLLTAVFTGLRASELRGLIWRNVDLNKRTLTVTQRADRYNEIGSPKARASRRTVPLAPDVVTALREQKIASHTDLVFPSREGTIQSLTSIHRMLGTLQAKLGWCTSHYHPKYGIHSLRHFAASLFIEEGFSPKRVQVLMGHSSIQVTFDTYGHLFPQEDEGGAFAKMQERLRPVTT
jgi:integrase